jgi:hypothetical protein
MSLSSYRLTIVVSLVAVAVAFMAGRWSVSQREDTPVRPAVSNATRGVNAVPVAAVKKASGRGITAAEAESKPSKERLTPALKERNRLTRLKNVLEWAESIDENNWRDALKVWLRSGASSGFGRDIEARVVMERIGAVGGAEAMEEIGNSSPNEEAVDWRLRQSMAGWASTHPQDAMDYYLKAGAPPGESRGGLMEGLSQSDLNLARQLSEQVREEWRDEHFRGIIENMNRNGEGSDAVKAWIDKSIQENKDPEYSAQLISTYVQRELELMQAGGGDTGVFDWLASRRSFPGESYQVLGAAAATLAHSHPEEAVNWLSSLTPGALSPEGMEESLAGVVTEWQSVRPGGAVEWLKANPNHPLHATMQNLLAEPALPGEDARIRSEGNGLLPR